MYSKMFPAMYQGSLATKGPWEAMVTFQQLLILSDPHGLVDMTTEYIAKTSTIPLEIIQKGIAALEEPDLQSRSSELDGRRIVRLSDTRDWGWEIVNYVQYHKIRNEEERRTYMRLYQRGYRKKNKENAELSAELLSVNNCKQNKPTQTQKKTQTKDEDEEEKKKINSCVFFEKFWKEYPHRNGKALNKPEARKRFLSLPAGEQEQVLMAMGHFKDSSAVQSNVGVKDAMRFLKTDRPPGEPWRDWLEPEKYGSSTGSGSLKAAERVIQQLKEREKADGPRIINP